MKVGLIVECTLSGLESTVCPKILSLLATETGIPIENEIRTMNNKKLLIQDAAKTAQILLEEGCERVVIMWDENPPWTPEKAFADERCWHVEREQILQDLVAEDIDLQRVSLVCIEREFETWLFHDVQLLEDVIGTDAHPARIKGLPNPLQIPDPKRFLNRLFGKHKSRFNVDIAARKFAERLTRLSRLKRCDTFRYFAQSILGRMPRGWSPYVYHPKGPRK